MTYSIDIINLSIYNYNIYLKKIKVCNILNIATNTFNNWFIKYNYYYVNNIQLTALEYKKIKNKNEHKSTKKTKYINLIIDYVNNNNGCSLIDINKNIVNNNISISTICKILKDNNISRKK